MNIRKKFKKYFSTQTEYLVVLIFRTRIVQLYSNRGRSRKQNTQIVEVRTQ